jgi:hypothetical protein
MRDPISLLLFCDNDDRFRRVRTRLDIEDRLTSRVKSMVLMFTVSDMTWISFISGMGTVCAILQLPGSNLWRNDLVEFFVVLFLHSKDDEASHG